MKSIAILGSTGSVGVTTLDVVGRFPDRFRVVAMAAGRESRFAGRAGQALSPGAGFGRNAGACARARARVSGPIVSTIVHGMEGAIAVATHPEAELVVSALVGALGLAPTLAAIKAARISASPTRKCWWWRARS